MQELARRELSRRHLLNFIQYNFKNYKVNWHHRLLIDALEKVERGELKRLMVFMPPRHGKSEICSIQFPAWFLGRNPSKEVICSSYSADLAVEFGRKTRNLVASPEYRNVFKAITLAEDSKAAGNWNTNFDGSYKATGAGGAITGKGADIFLVDDPVKNREEAESEVVRQSKWDWYRSTVRTRLNPNASIVFVVTRWHDADLAGMILSNDVNKEWTVISIPAIAENDEQFRKKSEALWPEQYPLKELESIKNDIGLYEWSSLYQQAPISSELQEFKNTFFKSRKLEEIKKLKTRCFVTIDTAISKSAEADNTGVCINWVDSENIWNFKAYKLRINPKELIDHLFYLYETHRPEKLGIEKTIYLDTLKPFLEDEYRKRNKFLPTFELDHQQKKKELRIRGLIPRYESGSIYHVEGEAKDLEEEAVRFPKGVHDDVLDAAAYQLQIAEPPMKEEAEEFGIYKHSYG